MAHGAGVWTSDRRFAKGKDAWSLIRSSFTASNEAGGWIGVRCTVAGIQYFTKYHNYDIFSFMSLSVRELPALHTTGTFPELAVYNHSLRMGAIIAALSSNGIRNLIDLGCGDGVFIKNIISNGLHLDEYVGVDAWQERLITAQADIELLNDSITFKEGSITDLENIIESPEHFRHFGAVVMLETIEHVPLEDVQHIGSGVFGYVSPRIVVVTTPDATKRLNAEQLQARGHYFEWDRAEFQDWAMSMTKQYPDYSVDIKQLSGPTFIRNTQIAVFNRAI